MRRYLLLGFSFLILACRVISAQDNPLPEYGEISELNEMQKVYVTADNADARERILKELSKYKRLSVVNSPDESEFLLVYTTKSRTDDVLVSQLEVSTATLKGRRRIHWAKTEKWTLFDKPNSVNLARNFIKALKKARGEK